MAIAGTEILILAGIAAIIFLFGGKKIPEFFHNLGKSKRAFDAGVAGKSLEEEEKKSGRE